MKIALTFDQDKFEKALKATSSVSSTSSDPFFRRFDIKHIPYSKSQLHRLIIAYFLCNLDKAYDKEAGMFHRAECEFMEDMAPWLNDLIETGILPADTATSLNCVSSFWNTFQQMSLIDTFCISCDESASALRFFLPIASVILSLVKYRQGMQVEIGLARSLASRSINDAVQTLQARGMIVTRHAPDSSYDCDCASEFASLIKLRGRLRPGKFVTSGRNSSQFISGLLMALPLLEEDSHIIVSDEIVSRPYIDMTLQILDFFAIQIDEYSDRDQTVFYIRGNQCYKKPPLKDIIDYVEPDMSGAAFWHVLGCIASLNRDSYCVPFFKGNVPESLTQKDSIIKDLSRFLYCLNQYIAHDSRLRKDSNTAISPNAPDNSKAPCAPYDLNIAYKNLLMETKEAHSKYKNYFDTSICEALNMRPLNENTLIIDLKDHPDLFPPLSILACGLNFRTILHGGSRLADKESNRLIAMKDGIEKLGGKCAHYIPELLSEGLIIYGDEMNSKNQGFSNKVQQIKRPLSGGAAFSYNDHRIAMSLALASLLSDTPVTLLNPFVTEKSYPKFYDVFCSIGGNIEHSF